MYLSIGICLTLSDETVRDTSTSIHSDIITSVEYLEPYLKIFFYEHTATSQSILLIITATAFSTLTVIVVIMLLKSANTGGECCELLS